MAGNKSCGSRSIQYGNRVHNVLSIDALLADGTEGRFGPLSTMPTDTTRLAAIVRRLQEIAVREHDEIARRSEEHTSELQSLMRISYAVFCLQKEKSK